MGIMKFVNVIFKNLSKKPVTKAYLNGESENYPLTRGHIEIDINKCIFCGLCSRKCPTVAITVEREKSMWKINRLDCIQCGYCIENCPKKCLFMKNDCTKASSEVIEDSYFKE